MSGRMLRDEYVLPKLGEGSKVIEKHGATLKVRKHSTRTWTLRNSNEGDRVRWGNAPQAREDIGYFLSYGVFPPRKDNWC